MTTPSADERFPFTAAPLQIKTIADAQGGIAHEALEALVKQAFAMLRASHQFAQGKVLKVDLGEGEHNDVQVIKGNSVQKGRLGKCAWHGRHSVHPPAESKGLTWDDFRAGLFINHPTQETEYIEEMTSATEVDVLLKGVAEVWNTTYSLPSLTANRDFLQLLLTLELPPHAEPYSPEHEAEFLASLSSISSPAAQAEPAPEGLKRSFLNIQVPVTDDKCPERAAEGYVRAFYASVEAISEDANGATDWRMFLQSDASGRIPLFFQEMAMPTKTAPDVPCFIKWKAGLNAASA